MIATVGLAFLAGILSVLSPCVLPLLPIVLGAAQAEHRLGPAALAVGLALSFTVIGLFVATVGFAIGLDSDVFRILSAMVLIGVDTRDGRPVKWLVENSWGADRGDKGRWALYDEWFDAYVFAVIIHKNHLPDDVLGLLETEPEVLPAWDPMRAAFH